MMKMVKSSTRNTEQSAVLDIVGFARLKLVEEVKTVNEMHLGLNLQSIPTIHFFKKEYFYCCYGYQALLIAEEFYGTRQVIRNDQNLESIDINRKLLNKIATYLLSHRYKILIWERSESEGWIKKIEACPGDIGQLEDEVGQLDKEVTSDFVVAVKFGGEETGKIGVAFVSTLQNQINMMEFIDDAEFSR
jgi:DNA mismatch repair ATPase MutS